MTEAEAINMPILPEEIQKFADAFVLADKLLEEALLAKDDAVADEADTAGAILHQMIAQVFRIPMGESKAQSGHTTITLGVQVTITATCTIFQIMHVSPSPVRRGWCVAQPLIRIWLTA